MGEPINETFLPDCSTAHVPVTLKIDSQRRDQHSSSFLNPSRCLVYFTLNGYQLSQSRKRGLNRNKYHKLFWSRENVLRTKKHRLLASNIRTNVIKKNIVALPSGRVFPYITTAGFCSLQIPPLPSEPL